MGCVVAAARRREGYSEHRRKYLAAGLPPHYRRLHTAAMHRSYQSILPTHNRLLQQRWDSTYYNEHRRKVRMIVLMVIMLWRLLGDITHTGYTHNSAQISPVLSAVTWSISSYVYQSDYSLSLWIRWIYRLIGWRALRTHKRFASANILALIICLAVETQSRAIIANFSHADAVLKGRGCTHFGNA